MSSKEHELLELLRKNPYASQQEIAEALQLSRPSIANLISGLVKSGKIKGRAYIVAEANPVLVFGGMNVDRKMVVKGQLMYQTSNPVTSYQTVGGVARNVAENLGRLGHEVKLMSVAGQDMEWEFLREQTNEWADLQHIRNLDQERTGTYTAVIDAEGEMQVAFADMEIYQHLTPEWVLTHEKLFKSATLVVVDLNLAKETVKAILTTAKTYNIPTAIVPVSGPKMQNLPDSLEGVTWMICNQGEAEMITGQTIASAEELEKAHQLLHNKGAQFVVITNGSDGVTMSEENHMAHINAIEPDVIRDVTGAGDSFVAALLHQWLEGKSSKASVFAGIVNATKTLESTYTVRTELTKELLEKEMEDYK
ncbi:PfkB family carbohydrate kinase [Chryseomicrobium palamuruense]|uniref:PfkB family carbohydrate kinase n=1 Tax=Chryseomicrobium palamuruense TaxID=682973 RepID=A0ABV8UYU7_9BACL